MNKRNKLRINTPDNSFNAFQTDSIILNPKLSSQPTEANQYSSETIGDSGNELSPLEMTKNYVTGKVTHILWSYSIYIALCLALIYLLLRPSDYSSMINEVQSLLQRQGNLEQVHEPQNVCLIPNGTVISPLSPLYGYGFLSKNVSDPNCIMEPNNECLALAGNTCSFNINMKNKVDIVKIGIYHPPSANPKSAISDFIIIINNKEIEFTFSGKGYEEFPVTGNTDTIRIDILNNYGCLKYTCIYRIYVYAV